jgi:hypothetical protein
MPHPPGHNRRAKAKNIDESHDSILTPRFSTKQYLKARSLFSPQNFKQRSAQTPHPDKAIDSPCHKQASLENDFWLHSVNFYLWIAKCHGGVA